MPNSWALQMRCQATAKGEAPFAAWSSLKCMRRQRQRVAPSCTMQRSWMVASRVLGSRVKERHGENLPVDPEVYGRGRRETISPIVRLAYGAEQWMRESSAYKPGSAERSHRSDGHFSRGAIARTL